MAIDFTRELGRALVHRDDADVLRIFEEQGVTLARARRFPGALERLG